MRKKKGIYFSRENALIKGNTFIDCTGIFLSAKSVETDKK